MDDRNIRRVFDQVRPTREQEEAMLERLLAGTERTERKPMKKTKKAAAVLLAAVVMLAACAFAVVSGLDQRLMDYFGFDEGEENLVDGSWVQVDQSHTYANGWTVEIKQLLADRYSVSVLANLVAPEDDMPKEGEETVALEMDVKLLDQQGNRRVIQAGSYEYAALEDADPNDREFPMLWGFQLADAGVEHFTGGSVELTPVDLVRSLGSRVDFRDEPWSCTVPLPEGSSGLSFPVNGTLELKDGSVPLPEVYLSPIRVAFVLSEPTRELQENMEYLFDMDHTKEVSVTLSDGRSIAMRNEGMTMSIDEPGDDPEESAGLLLFWPEEFIDPVEVASVTILGQTFSLEGLTPTAG